MLDGILQVENAGLRSGFVPDVVGALLAKAELARPPNDRREGSTRPIFIREAHTHCAATRVDDDDRRRLRTLRRDTPGTALTSAREGGGIAGGGIAAVRRDPACAGHTPHVTPGRLQREPCIQRGALCWSGQQPRQHVIGRLLGLLSSGGARFTCPGHVAARGPAPHQLLQHHRRRLRLRQHGLQRCLLRPCAGLLAHRVVGRW